MQDELKIQLYDAYKYLSVSNAYQKLIEKYQNNTRQYRNNYYNLKNRSAPKTSNASIKLSLIVPGFLFFVMIFAVENIWGRLFSLLAFAVVIFIGISSKKINNKSGNKQNDKFRKEAEEYWQKTGGPAERKNMQTIQRIRSEKEKFEKEYSGVLDIVPYNYRSESAVGFLLYAILNKRADNLKEALNLYEEELHRVRMENAMNNIANAIEESNYNLERQLSGISASIDVTNSRLRNIENMEFYQILKTM